MEREERAAFMIFRNNFKIDIEQIHHLIMLSENLRFEDDKGDLRTDLFSRILVRRHVA